MLNIQLKWTNFVKVLIKGKYFSINDIGEIEKDNTDGIRS